jgi:hypothetical protein
MWLSITGLVFFVHGFMLSYILSMGVLWDVDYKSRSLDINVDKIMKEKKLVHGLM